MATAGTKLRFNVQDDIYLLRETVGQNPFEDSSKWKSVTDNIVKVTNKSFSVRAVREHVSHLFKLWKKSDFGNLLKSGTNEQYQEKEELLQEAMSLKDQYERPKKRMKREEEAELREQVLENVQVIVDDASVSLDDSLMLETDSNGDGADGSTREAVPIGNVKYENIETSVSGPSTIMRTGINGSLLEYLRKAETEKRNKEMELNVRKEELEIEKKKLDLLERQTALEEKKFALEEEKVREKIRLEALDQEERLKQAEQQRKLLDIFVEKFLKER